MPPKKRKAATSTLGSARESKQRICSVRSSVSPPTDQTILSFMMSAAASTTTAPASCGYSSCATRELSTKWWLPTATDCAESEWNSYSSSSSATKSNSWSRIQCHRRKKKSLPKTFLPSSLCSWPESTEPAGTTTSVLRIKLRLTRRQRKNLDLAFRANRFTYNKIVEQWRAKNIQFNKTDFREVCTRKDAIDANLDEYGWLKDVPYDIRDSAVIDVYNAIKSSRALHKNTGKAFELSFRSYKRDKSESFSVLHRCWRDGVVYPHAWGREPLRGFEKLPEVLNHDCRLQRTWLNEFYLCIPIDRQPSEEPRSVAKVIALDPGVRTFMTGYDPDGVVLEWGVGDMTRIGRLQHAYSKLQSRVADKSATKRRKRGRIRKAMRRIDRKVQNLTDDTHKKLSSALCAEYETILIPKFQSQRMSRRADRKLGKRTVRDMQNWRHCAFRQRLITKAKTIPGCRVIECDEAYTTKTCGRCGELNHVGRSKTFRCSSCNLVSDRDWNAARNICIRTVCERGFFDTRCDQAPSATTSECTSDDTDMFG